MAKEANKYEEANKEFFANLFKNMGKVNDPKPFPMHSMAFPEEERVKVDCKHCGKEFSTFYRTVQYCSTECGRLALAEIGIDWTPKPRLKSEKWSVRHTDIPLKTIIAMKRLIKRVEEKYPLPGEWQDLPELDIYTLKAAAKEVENERLSTGE